MILIYNKINLKKKLIKIFILLYFINDKFEQSS